MKMNNEMKSRFLKPFAIGLIALMFAVACGDGSEEETETTDDTTDMTDNTEDTTGVTVVECTTATGVDKIVCLIDALKGELTSSQISEMQLTYSKSNAQRWSNFPEAIYGNRLGLMLGDLTDDQIDYVIALLKEVAGTGSHEGLEELRELLYADDYLGENGGGSSYGYENYFIAILGTPSTSGTFEIQFGGHHLAFANTYTDGALAGATPSFRGAEPFFEFEWEGTSYQPLVQDRDALSAMLNSLSATELASAKLSGTYSDLVAGPQKDDNFPGTPSGIACSALSESQRTLVLAAIATYVEDVADEDAAEIMATYKEELDDTYISYSGNTSLSIKNDYVRIDGPSVWIEYSTQSGIIFKNETHPHSVWRDKVKDYGGN